MAEICLQLSDMLNLQNQYLLPNKHWQELASHFSAGPRKRWLSWERVLSLGESQHQIHAILFVEVHEFVVDSVAQLGGETRKVACFWAGLISCLVSQQ
jgi:hypothetical protein